jgi:predicted metal-dependent phosphoesterase TrpH
MSTDQDSPRFDLQAHSTCSDGTLGPAEVVRRAAAAGVELLALTDHDTVAGVPEALLAAQDAGIRLSCAVELSAVHEEYEDLHVLGYELGPTDPGLQAALADFRADRGRRVMAMADRLRELGFALDERELAHRESVGRPHLAAALLAEPANAERLADEGIGGLDELFAGYLVPGARAYVPRSRPTVEEAIAVIHAAGGVAIWAHPFWNVSAPADALRALRRFVAADLDGVECFYITHTREQTLLLHDECEARGLLSTGSTDFHGPEHERFHSFRAFDLHGREPRLGPIGSRG